MKKCVLYVDDESNNLRALERLLHGEPFELALFNSPEEALDKINEIRPAVVISDYRMPQMPGTVFLEKVKKEQPDSIRIILTGYPDLEMAISSINRGNVFRFIEKPWNENELKSQIKAALDYHEAISTLHAFGKSGSAETVLKKEQIKAMNEQSISVRHELYQYIAIITAYSNMLKEYLEKDSIPSTYLANIFVQLKKMERATTKITTIPESKINTFRNGKMIDIDKS